MSISNIPPFPLSTFLTLLLNSPIEESPQALAERIHLLVTHYPDHTMSKAFVALMQDHQAYQAVRISLQNPQVKKGDTILDAPLYRMETDFTSVTERVHELVKEGQLYLFMFVPGTGTKTCTKDHLPDVLYKDANLLEDLFAAAFIITPNTPDNALAWTNQFIENFGRFPPKVKIYGAKTSNIGDLWGVLRASTKPRALGVNFHRLVVITLGQVVKSVLVEENAAHTSSTDSLAIRQAVANIYH